METIKQYIEQNLVDFYLSFKNENDYYENSNIHSINGQQGNWPSFVLLKNYSFTFKKIIDSVKQAKNSSKNWVLDNDFFLKNKTEIKQYKLFPIKSWTGMFINTDKLITEKKLTNFSFEQLKKGDLKNYIELINTTTFGKDVLSFSLFNDKLENPNFNFFVGKYNNEIVSTCLIYNDGNTNGLYFITTKKSFQNKGFGSLLIIKSINELIKKGEKKFILHATKMGSNIYKKIGFKIYSKLIIFTKI